MEIGFGLRTETRRKGWRREGSIMTKFISIYSIYVVVEAESKYEVNFKKLVLLLELNIMYIYYIISPRFTSSCPFLLGLTKVYWFNNAYQQFFQSYLILKLKSSEATYPTSNAKSLACDTANEHALTCTREKCSCSQTAVQWNQWRWSVHTYSNGREHYSDS